MGLWAITSRDIYRTSHVCNKCLSLVHGSGAHPLEEVRTGERQGFADLQ
jgi:hypothetical protein